jgi:hypothetical protein
MISILDIKKSRRQSIWTGEKLECKENESVRKSLTRLAAQSGVSL